MPTVSRRNPEVRIEVELSASVSILVARDQRRAAPVVLDVYADTRAAGRHYLGAVTLDVEDTSDPKIRPAIVAAIAWVPGAIGYVVQLTQIETVSGADVALGIDLAAGPPATAPGLTQHRDASIRTRATLPTTAVQLAAVGPRKLVSVSALLEGVAAGTVQYLLFFDASATDAPIVAGISPFASLPVVANSLVGLGSDDIDAAPVLRCARGIRAVLSSTPGTFTAPMAGALVTVNGWTRG